MIGRRLGRYHVLAEIGAGGMGVVYRARDERLKRDVALKVLPTGAVGDEVSRERFRREAQILSQLTHPHIATVHDFDTQDGVDFLVMEFVPGRSLAQVLKSGALLEKDVVEIGLQISDALVEAHEHGVIHRDLKPGNILLTPKGQVKVLDFGLAKLMKPLDSATSLAESLTEEGTVAGTLHYMSPEQLRGEEVDERSDLYSTGAVLYELASGQTPFPETQTHVLIESILHNMPPPPSTIGPSVSKSLDVVVQQNLRKDRRERHQSASELQTDLRQLAAGITILDTHALRQKSLRRWLALAFSGIGSLAALIMLLNPGGWRDRLLSSRQESAIEAIAVLPFKNLSDDASEEYLADGMTEQLISSLANIRALRVISRTSIMKYKDSGQSIQEIAEDLDVDAVLEGSVARSGSRVRISANLIDVSSERHLMTEEREGELSEILGLQRAVAQAVANKTRISLTPREEARIAADYPVNPEAYQLYLRGRYSWNKREADDLEKALGYFEQAVEIDPGFPYSYVGMADCYNLFERYGVLPPDEAFPKAKQAAQKALSLDQEIGEAHTSLAFAYYLYDRDWDSARREFELALEQNSNYATTHHWYSVFLRGMGQMDEALVEAEHARRLDPLSSIIVVNLGDTYFFRSEFENALERYREALELHEYFRPALIGMGYAYSQLGQSEQAIEAAEQAHALADDDARVGLALAYVRGKAGDVAGARDILSRFVSQQSTAHVFPTLVAAANIAIGEEDRAFELLQAALKQRDADLVYLKVDPRFDSVRADPRFTTLLQEVGFDN
jgi:serine/threonine protein kinase/Tfp pilus assembly protein PilF